MIAVKLLDWYRDGGRIPRRVKKKVLGRKKRRRDLRKMLSETRLGEPIKTMFERRVIEPHGMFCPTCGESNYVGTGNRAEYPEHWEYFHCLRCRRVVGYIDNSPFVHALECEDYNPVF